MPFDFISLERLFMVALGTLIFETFWQFVVWKVWPTKDANGKDV